jgi:hypothetical protein
MLILRLGKCDLKLDGCRLVGGFPIFGSVATSTARNRNDREKDTQTIHYLWCMGAQQFHESHIKLPLQAFEPKALKIAKPHFFLLYASSIEV